MGCEERGVGEFGVEKGEKMLEQDIRFLAEELEKGKLIIFVGAGVSKNSGLPEWKELIKDYADYRGIDKFTSKQFLTIPEEVFERFGSLKYYEIAEKRFSGKYVPNSIHRILKKMNLTYIVTTNYDTLIEDEIKNLQIVSKDEDLPYTNSNRMLIKMHGDFKNKNIVLKKSDYDNYEKNFPLISTLIKGLFTTNTILFIGYSYNDVNVQQIMNWIKEILKEETRKAFLVEFTEKDDKEEENGEQINRISLKLLTENNDEILYADKKGRVDYDYEKTLTEFLLNIYNEKENVRQEKNFEIYKNLNYLTKHNWKKLSKYSEIYIDKDWKRILNTRFEFKDIEKYEEILFKSRIKKVVQNINRNEKEILIPFSEKEITPERKKQKENLEELIGIEERFLKTIYDYDYQNFQNLVEKYIESNNINKYVIVYGYLFFKNIDEAKKIIECMIEEKENFNSKNEKLVWDNFILSIIEFMEITHTEENLNKTFESIEESLEDKYFEYFKYETELFNEIFKYSTLEAINEEMNRLFDKAREEKRVSYVGTPPLYQAIILSRDLFYFCSLNGIFGKSFSPYSEFMKKYIEILLVSYTNKNVELKNQMFENRNLLEEFEYFDFFMMLELSYSDLKKLFNEYTIKDLKCKEEILDRLIVLLKNIFDWIEENDKEFMEKKDALENVILIISKLDLTKNQFKNLFNVILNYKNNSIFFEDNPILGIVNNFRIITYKNFKNLNKEFFDKVLEKIFSIERNRIDKNLLDYITYYFKKKEMPKISKNDRIENFINKNNLKIKGYFLRIIDETYFEELKNEILKEIKETLDIESYSFLLNQKFIDFIPETEDKILEELDEIFQKKDDDNKDLNMDTLVNLISKQENILDFLLVSGLNDRLPISFIEKLRNYENEEFFKSLEQYQLKVLWKYILYSDYSEFTGNELEKFSKIGIKNLLKKNDKKLIKLVREYIFFKIKNNDKISNNSIVEAYFEWESEKIETSK